MNILSAYMFMYNMQAWCPRILEEDTGYPGTGFLLRFRLFGVFLGGTDLFIYFDDFLVYILN